MSKIFTTATEARRNTRNSVLIHNEIRSIENQVLAAVQDGDLSVEIDDTELTTLTAYYNVWFGITQNATLRDQIDFVQEYFRNLGYNFQILENTQTGNTLTWRITW
jgi:hypothetical protein